MKKFIVLGSVAAVALLVAATVAEASHSWGGYHWARVANPVVLKLGNDLSSPWLPFLAEASTDWNASTSPVQTIIVPGSTIPKNCRAVAGRVEVCNSKYGNNGWLGIASIWANGLHITQGTVKLNDTYFATAKYNTPAWKRLVMCQEVAHTFGLDHQDEIFDNLNLGTCMDYTNDPDGTIVGQLTNEHPNAHDFAELGTIYAHLDTFTSAFMSSGSSAVVVNSEEGDGPAAWGKEVSTDQKGRASSFERDLGNGKKQFTFVVWAD